MTGVSLCRRTIYDDPFIRNYIEDLLENIRTQVCAKHPCVTSHSIAGYHHNMALGSSALHNKQADVQWMRGCQNCRSVVRHGQGLSCTDCVCRLC